MGQTVESTLNKAAAHSPWGGRSETVERVNLGFPAPHLSGFLIPLCVCDMGHTGGCCEALSMWSVNPVGQTE